MLVPKRPSGCFVRSLVFRGGGPGVPGGPLGRAVTHLVPRVLRAMHPLGARGRAVRRSPPRVAGGFVHGVLLDLWPGLVLSCKY